MENLFNDANQKIGEIAGKIQGFKADHSKFKIKVDAAIEEILALIETAKKSKVRIRTKIADKQREIAYGQQQLKQLTSSGKQGADEIAEQLKALQASSAQLQSQIQVLQAEKDNLQRANQQLSQKSNNANLVNDYSAAITEKDKEIAQLRSELAQNALTIKEREDQNTQQYDALEKSQQDIQALVDRITVLYKDVDGLIEQANEEDTKLMNSIGKIRTELLETNEDDEELEELLNNEELLNLTDDGLGLPVVVPQQPAIQNNPLTAPVNPGAANDVSPVPPITQPIKTSVVEEKKDDEEGKDDDGEPIDAGNDEEQRDDGKTVINQLPAAPTAVENPVIKSDELSAAPTAAVKIVPNFETGSESLANMLNPKAQNPVQYEQPPVQPVQPVQPELTLEKLNSIFNSLDELGDKKPKLSNKTKDYKKPHAQTLIRGAIANLKKVDTEAARAHVEELKKYYTDDASKIFGGRGSGTVRRRRRRKSTARRRRRTRRST